jgi:hypothetical protein
VGDLAPPDFGAQRVRVWAREMHRAAAWRSTAAEGEVPGKYRDRGAASTFRLGGLLERSVSWRSLLPSAEAGATSAGPVQEPLFPAGAAPQSQLAGHAKGKILGPWQAPAHRNQPTGSRNFQFAAAVRDAPPLTRANCRVCAMCQPVTAHSLQLPLPCWRALRWGTMSRERTWAWVDAIFCSHHPASVIRAAASGSRVLPTVSCDTSNSVGRGAGWCRCRAGCNWLASRSARRETRGTAAIPDRPRQADGQPQVVCQAIQDPLKKGFGGLLLGDGICVWPGSDLK